MISAAICLFEIAAFWGVLRTGHFSSSPAEIRKSEELKKYKGQFFRLFSVVCAKFSFIKIECQPCRLLNVH